MRNYLLAATAVAVASPAFAGNLTFDQGFEVDTSGFFDGVQGAANYGTITRVASGTGGISSSSGSFHALVAETDSAPFTRFDGYRSNWSGGFTAAIDVYLDPDAFALGEGFDYSVAASRQAGSHLRDFIFHVTKDTNTGRLLVGGSNNTGFAPREDLEDLNNFEVNSAGWYTFEHNAYENVSGDLAVDMNLRDSSGTLLFTETRSDSSDDIATIVGGNRYGWFTAVDVSGGLAIDNVSLSVVPEPLAAIGGISLLSIVGLRRRHGSA
jgi:hypothetical protein